MARISLIICLMLACVAGCQEAPPCTTQMATQASPSTTLTVGGTPQFSTDAIPTDPAKYPYNHASSIAEMPDGDLLIAWVAGSKEAARDTAIIASRRRKSESAWGMPVVVSSNADHGHANPVLFVDDQKTVWLFYSELIGAGQLCLSKVYSRTSLDNGITWAAPKEAVDSLCLLGRNKPIVLRSGEWLLPLYWEAIFQSRMWGSTNRGATWSEKSAIITLPSTNLQPAVVQCADGSLFALMRNGSDTGFTWEARSTDCGATWKTKERPGIPNPGSALDMIRLSTGDFLLVCNPSTKERTPIAALISTDEGKTWSAPKLIETGQPQFSYPSVIQASDGTIHVSYSHRLAHIQHAEFNMAWLAGNSP